MDTRSFLVLACAGLALTGCAARSTPPEVPVASASATRGTLEQRQRQTSVAYRDLQQARYEKRLAEQDVLNAQSAFDTAQRTLDAAKKSLAAATAREKKAADAYEAGLRAVDESFRTPASR